jgi:hypothetical protein
MTVSNEEQLKQRAENYVILRNTGDKEGWEKNCLRAEVQH